MALPVQEIESLTRELLAALGLSQRSAPELSRRIVDPASKSSSSRTGRDLEAHVRGCKHKLATLAKKNKCQDAVLEFFSSLPEGSAAHDDFVTGFVDAYKQYSRAAQTNRPESRSRSQRHRASNRSSASSSASSSSSTSASVHPSQSQKLPSRAAPASSSATADAPASTVIRSRTRPPPRSSSPSHESVSFATDNGSSSANGHATSYETEEAGARNPPGSLSQKLHELQQTFVGSGGGGGTAAAAGGSPPRVTARSSPARPGYTQPRAQLHIDTNNLPSSSSNGLLDKSITPPPNRPHTTRAQQPAGGGANKPTLSHRARTLPHAHRSPPASNVSAAGGSPSLKDIRERMRTPGTSSTASDPTISSPERRALMHNNDHHSDAAAASDFDLRRGDRTPSQSYSHSHTKSNSQLTHADELRTQYTSDYSHVSSRPGTSASSSRSEMPQTAPTRFRSDHLRPQQQPQTGAKPDLQAIKGSPHRNTSPQRPGTGAASGARGGMHSPLSKSGSAAREKPATPSPTKLGGGGGSREVDEQLEETRRLLASAGIGGHPHPSSSSAAQSKRPGSARASSQRHASEPQVPPQAAKKRPTSAGARRADVSRLEQIRPGDQISLRSVPFGYYAHINAGGFLQCSSSTPFLLTAQRGGNAVSFHDGGFRFGSGVHLQDKANRSLCSMPTSISPAMRSMNSRQRPQPTITPPVVKAVLTAQHSRFTSWVLVNVDDMYEAKSGGGSGRDTSRTHSEIGGHANKEIVKVGALVVLRCEHGYMTARGDGSIHVSDMVSEASKWQISKDSVPYIPEWSSERRGVLRTSVDADGGFVMPREKRSKTFELLPNATQQKLLVNDLLFALMGIESNYFTFATASESKSKPAVLKCQFNSAVQMDPSTAHIIKKLLPLCEAYARIERFCDVHSGFPYGLCSHALCEALKTRLKDYHILIAQLDTLARRGELTLQKLWFYVQSWLSAMVRIAKLCDEISHGGAAKATSRSSKGLNSALAAFAQRSSVSAEQPIGGALLNVIHRFLSMAGDVETKRLYSFLLRQAAVPYFRMLTQWIYRGAINDPYNEFLVVEDSDLTPRIQRNRRQSVTTSPSRHLSPGSRRRASAASVSSLASTSVYSNVSTEEFRAGRYWEDRYQIRDAMIPTFLEHITQKVLHTGKYLNVIRESGRKVEFPSARELAKFATGKSAAGWFAARQKGLGRVVETKTTALEEAAKLGGSSSASSSGLLRRRKDTAEWKLSYSDDSSEYFEHIDAAHAFASQRLLAVLVLEENLIARLRSIQRYFFLSPGDFYVHFMDSSEDELRLFVVDKRSRDSSNQVQLLDRLESLLDLAIRSSSAADDPFCDDVQCLLQNMPLIDQVKVANSSLNMSAATPSLPKQPNGITGLQALSFQYRVQWPLSLVITQMSLHRYNWICRHLFSLKQVDRDLSALWLKQQKALKELDVTASALRVAHGLRQCMVHLVKSFLYYLHVEVLHPNTLSLEQSIAAASTVDEVMEIHAQFLSTCVKECLVSDLELLKNITDLIEVCQKFAAFMSEACSEPHANAASRTRGGAHAHARGTTQLHERRARIEIYSQAADRAFSTPAFEAGLRELQKDFNERLYDFLRNLRQRSATEVDSRVSHLITRLDFNGFYSRLR